MAYAVLRLLYNLWLLGAGLLFINAASRAVFGREPRRLRLVAVALALAAAWPVALFSPPGRRILFKRINKL